MEQNIQLKFEELIQTIDAECTDLHSIHSKHTSCQKGCDQCCMNFSVLPVEFEYIRMKIQSNKRKITTSKSDDCLFLKDHVCTIYSVRPIICRTHGLPILTMNEEGENWELSFCPLNFKKVETDYFQFENCYEQDQFNSKLYLLNEAFLSTHLGASYKTGQLVDLKMLNTFLEL